MARRTPEMRKRRVGYAETHTEPQKGSWIHCNKCGYIGLADVILSTVLHTGGLERCAMCKSLDFEVTMENNMNENQWKQDEWSGCYPSRWTGLIVPEAMSHPAKFSSRLIRRIYEHLKEEGWLKAGDTVIDPFGGIALGALDAMRLGLKWRGVELEGKFSELGNWNISNWNAKFANMPKWSGDAVLYKGDSRKLLQVLSEPPVEGAISSPPFEQRSADGGWQMFGRYAEEGKLTVKQVKGDPTKSYPSWDKERDTSYGTSDGQMANMKSSTEGFEAAISSPPFLQSEGGTPEPKPGGVIDKRLYARHAAGNGAAEGYGATPGQLANMGEGDFEGAASSPPFAGVLAMETVNAEERRKLARESGISNAEHISPIDMELIGKRNQKDEKYGFSEGQLGAMKEHDESGDDFWLVARLIVEQVYKALAPGGHAAWVVKGYVKNKQYVDFPDQWRRLCEAVGFVTLHEHRALLVHVKGSSQTFEGDTIVHKTESKSFFRRLAEKKGSPRIDYETVWCMEKPHE